MRARLDPAAGADVGPRGRRVVRLAKVVLDCPEPQRLADFYAELLGSVVDAGSGPDWVDLAGPGKMLSFQRVPGYEAPSWPDGVPQQMHLDLEVDEFSLPHERVLALGARPLDPLTPPAPADRRGYRVYADPAGHPFCLCLAATAD